MSDSVKTLLFVIVAVVLAAAAGWVAPSDDPPPVFDDQGEEFFPDFGDPIGAPDDPTVTSLEVIDFDTETASAKPFKVEFAQGLWSIPSHHGYPADAKDRLAKTAAGVVGLRKDRVVTDNPQDHGELSVLDPLDEEAALEGRGKRVTLRDKNGNALADFIVGKDVKQGTGMKYVRLPEQNRVYAVKFGVDLTARFADWIETDLLKLDDTKLREVVLDNYSVDETTGTLDPGETLVLEKKDKDWELEGLAEGEELDTTTVDDLVDALSELAIVGVRRKPEGLSADLRAAEGLRLGNAAMISLQQKGYFVTQAGQLVSNEGELRARTTEGVAYTLRFGEVLYGSGDEVSSGADADATSGGGEETPDKKGTAENRYLFVTVGFDESAFEKPEPPAETTDDDESGDAESGDAEDAEGEDGGDDSDDSDDADDGDEDPEQAAKDKQAAAERAQKDYERELADYERKVKEGKERVAELTDRFADWYFVISAEKFAELRRSRADLIEEPEEPDEQEPETPDETEDPSVPDTPDQPADPAEDE